MLPEPNWPGEGEWTTPANSSLPIPLRRREEIGTLVTFAIWRHKLMLRMNSNHRNTEHFHSPTHHYHNIQGLLQHLPLPSTLCPAIKKKKITKHAKRQKHILKRQSKHQSQTWHGRWITKIRLYIKLCDQYTEGFRTNIDNMQEQMGDIIKDIAILRKNKKKSYKSKKLSKMKNVFDRFF